MVLGDPRQAHQRTQSLHFPSSFINHSTIACCSNAQTPSSLSHTWTLDRLRARRRFGPSLGLRAVEVVICMITRDFSVISIDVTGVSLSLSLSQKSLTHNIGSASALPMDPFLVCCLGEKWRLSVGRSRSRARQNHREAMEEGEQRLLSAKIAARRRQRSWGLFWELT